MAHFIKLYPNSDTSVTNLPGLRPQQISPDAREVWVDLRIASSVNQDHEIWQTCDHIVVYDWFHAADCINPILVNQVRELQKIAPVTWISTHILNIADVKTQRWDYMWNRCRQAYLEKKPSWKQGPDPADYVQYPLHWQPRSHRYLCLYNRPEPFRDRLHRMVQHYQGYWSNRSLGKWLEPNTLNTKDFTLLPRREYLNTSYISCQVESTHLSGYGICFTEKTYDHLIQCRLTLNFGPAGFYQALENDGWRLYQDIDLSWDKISNNELRLQAYLNCLENLFQLSDLDMHDLFLVNKDVIIHNYNRLETKPYDYLD